MRAHALARDQLARSRDSVGEGTLTGYSQNFGTATFKIAAFNRIEFNIYDPEMEDKRLAEDW